ncbi:GAF domain-containing protein [Methylobacterium sp. JK268]
MRQGDEPDEPQRQAPPAEQRLRTSTEARDEAWGELRVARSFEAEVAAIMSALAQAPGDADRVLHLIIESSTRLFAATSVSIHLAADDAASRQVWVGANAQRVGRASPSTSGGGLPGVVVSQDRSIHVADLDDPDASVADWPGLSEARAAGARALSGTPLRREGRAVGALMVFRDRPLPFTRDELALQRTFADQAVIAIEIARLREQVQARTRDLEESLARQTATADVLKAISRSAFDLDGVLVTLVEAARDLCRASIASISVVSDGFLRFRALAGGNPEFEAFLRGHPFPIAAPTRANNAGRVLLTQAASYVEDVANEPDYAFGSAPRLGGFRSLLGVPLMRDGDVIGVFQIGAPEPGALSPRQIDLVAAFADQAVIAIENARLIEEVRARTREVEEALAQQTATAEVLKTISRSAFDLQKVLDTLIASAAPLAGADSGLIYLRRDDAFYVQAHFDPGSEPDFVELLKSRPQRPGRGSVGARVLLTGDIVHVPDNRLEPDYDPALLAATVSRAVLGVPLKRDGAIVGAIALARRDPGSFTTRHIELAQTFADQAVIAIENSRLLGEVQTRTWELERSLDDLRNAQNRLVQSEKLASLGQLTAGIAHEIKNPLNFVNNFASVSRELIEELRETLKALPEDAKADAHELMDMIASNLEKVASHGKRADSIVKNMLLHAREGSGECASVDVNAMVEEALNLGYQSVRAEKPGFDVTLEKNFDPEAGEADLHLQEITRVLLNLISNGFYAVASRKEMAGSDYAPTLTAATRNLGDRVEIRIRDNGTGVPEEVRAKMFNPFFTTKPAGEGTGLGLSLSHDIVVKQHGGTLDVETAPNAFTELVVTLPRRIAGAGRLGGRQAGEAAGPDGSRERMR